MDGSNSRHLRNPDIMHGGQSAHYAGHGPAALPAARPHRVPPDVDFTFGTPAAGACTKAKHPDGDVVAG